MYKEKALKARRKVLEIIHKAQTSHIASNFSVIDIATVLYDQLSKDDAVVWSKGWAAATIYYFLAQQGTIPKEDLEKFPQSPYLGLAETSVPGVLCNGGAVGHGAPIAVGIALGKKRAGLPGTVYCLMSDGEWDEGSTWEAALAAGHHKLDNLVFITDFNLWQAMGKTEDVLNLEPATVKWEAFNWKAIRIDGHDHGAIEDALTGYFSKYLFPKMIVADTVKGKGVSFFENPPEHKTMGSTGHLYHYKNIDLPTYEAALKELV